MKYKCLLTAGSLIGGVLSATTPEPPAEVIQQLDFFKSMSMIENDQFGKQFLLSGYDVPVSSMPVIRSKEAI